MPFERERKLRPDELYYAMIGMVQKSPHRFKFQTVLAGDDETPEFGRVYWDTVHDRRVVIYYPGLIHENNDLKLPTLEDISRGTELPAVSNILNQLLFYPIADFSLEQQHFVSASFDKIQLTIVDTRGDYADRNLPAIAEKIDRLNPKVIQHDWQAPYEDWKSGYFVLHQLHNLIHSPQVQVQDQTEPEIDDTFILRMKNNYRSAKKTTIAKLDKQADTPKLNAIFAIKKQIFRYQMQVNPFLLNRDTRVLQLKSLLTLVENTKYSVGEAISLWKQEECQLSYSKNKQQTLTNAQIMQQHYFVFHSSHRPDKLTRIAKFVQELEIKYADVDGWQPELRS